MKIKLLLLLCLVPLAGFIFAVTLTIGDIAVYYSKLVGIAARSTGGDYAVVSSLGESVGAVNLSGGDYTMESSMGAIAASKLANDLSNAHCYPNPFKPNSGLGHTKIIFSQLTSYTKLRVYNIAGELVYEKEEETPNGELSWDVVNNNGEKLASGVYIYLITDTAGNKAKGKVAVVR